jgi:hypothetical protein
MLKHVYASSGCATAHVLPLTCIFGLFLRFAGKTHWSKRVTENIFAAGRLTERQIKYAYEDGE